MGLHFPHFLRKIREKLQKPIVEIKLIHDGTRFRKIQNVEEISIEGLILCKKEKQDPIKPWPHNPSTVITIPCEFIDIKGKSFEAAYHILENDGRDTLVFRGVKNGMEVEKKHAP